MSNEWAGLTAIVGVVQAAASRLARKPEIEGALPTIAFDAALEEDLKAPAPPPPKPATAAPRQAAEPLRETQVTVDRP